MTECGCRKHLGIAMSMYNLPVNLENKPRPHLAATKGAHNVDEDPKH